MSIELPMKYILALVLGGILLGIGFLFILNSTSTVDTIVTIISGSLGLE